MQMSKEHISSLLNKSLKEEDLSVPKEVIKLNAEPRPRQARSQVNPIMSNKIFDHRIRKTKP